MKRSREDNTVAVIQEAIKFYGIKVTGTSVRETLKANSYYPTFRSICDSFNEWKIEHYPLRYDKEEIRKLQAPYIAHFNKGGGQIVFVSETNDSGINYYESLNKRKRTGWNEFLENCSGAVVLLNPHNESGERDYYKKLQDEILGKTPVNISIGILTLFIITFIIQFIKSESFINLQPLYPLVLTKIIGIVFSAALVLYEFEIRFPLYDKLCHLNHATNCNSVLNDKAAKVFSWIGWADMGLIYFVSTFLILLQTGLNEMNFILALTATLALPYTFFSVWYQGFVVRKWCPLCLGVQAVLITEFVILLPYLRKVGLSFSIVAVYLLTFFAVGLIYFLLMMYLRERKLREILQNKNLKFKTNPEIIKSLLFSQRHYNIPSTDLSLTFGQADAPVCVTAFLSLNCSHCTRAFYKIEEILQSVPIVRIQIVLITSDQKIINTLYHLKRIGKEEESITILKEWYNSDPYSRQMFSDNFCLTEAEDVAEVVNNTNTQLFRNCEVPGTPTFFINGYKLPDQYDIEDLKYFSTVLTEKEVLN